MKTVFRRLGKSTRLFLLLSLVLLVSDLALVTINYRAVQQQFEASMREQSAQQRSAYQLGFEMELDNLVKMAYLVAADPRNRQLFLAGKQAVLREGGGPGGSEAARYREELMAHIQGLWQQMRDDFGMRQLHFHIGPGSLSFLRAHKPEKFGDRMDDLRHIIVDANRDGRSRQGFETGRVYSGLRGVAPIFAMDEGSGERSQIGAVEMGASFDHLFEVMDRQLGSGIAALLRHDHVEGKMWQEQIRTTFDVLLERSRYAVDGSSRPEIADILTAHGELPKFDDQGYLLSFIELRGRLLAVTHLPLLDYVAQRDGSNQPVGRILLWHDVTTERALMRQNMRDTLLFACFGYLLVELLLYWGVRYSAGRLQAEIDHQTAKLVLLKDRAEAADRAKSTFLTNVGHELRTPMNIIMGLSWQTLQERLDRDQRERFDKIYQTCNQLLGMIEALLDLSRLGRGETLDNRAEAFLLSTFLNTIQERYADAARCKGLAFEIRVASKVPRVLRGDGRRLGQALGYIVDNGIKFTQQGGIVVEVMAGEPEPGGCLFCFAVTDTGIGLSAALATRLLEPFTQGEDAASRHRGGMGLGITISSKLLETMDGWLEIESAPGRGACFRVFARLALGDESLAEPSASIQTPGLVPTQTDERSKLASLLRRLKPLLLENDPEALNLSAQLARFAAAPGLREEIIGLQAEIDALAFDGALIALDGLETKL